MSFPPHRFAFDLDGTLVSCQERQVAVALTVAHEREMKGFGPRAFWHHKRAGRTTLEAFVEMGFSREIAKTAAADWQLRIESAEWLRLDRLLPSAVSAISRVRRRGFSPVVITARHNVSAVRPQLERLGLEKLIDDMLVVSPGAQEIEKCGSLERLNAFAFIGDTESDARAAARAGISFAAVGTGQRDPVFLESCGVRPIYNDVGAAAKALLAIPWVHSSPHD